MNSEMPRSHDQCCFACGENNPDGLNLKFVSEVRGQARTAFVPELYHQSYADTLHGGIQSLILDACMVQALKTLGEECVTAKLEIRYESPVFLRETIISAMTSEQLGEFFVVTAELKHGLITKTTARGIYKRRSDNKREGSAA